jgi:hypothetical protein
MGGKGGGQSTTSTVTQQDIPKEFYPYFERLLVRGEEESLRDYQPYGGQRLALPGQDVNQSRGMIRDLAANGTPGVDQAAGIVQDNIGDVEGMMGQSPYQFSQAQFSDPSTMTPEMAQSYMSPYMQNVVDAQKAKATEDYQMAEAGRNASAVSAGAFGGSRQAVMEGMAQRDLLTRQGDIQSQGLQSAYADANARFEADRAARFATEGARAGELGRVQGSQAEENRAGQSFDLQALGFKGDQAAQLAQLSEAARAGDIQAAQLLETIGRGQQSEEQAGYDLSYEDFVRQQGYNQDQLNVMSSLLRGLPIAPTGTQTQMVPYNPIQQALGAGISALGLYRGMSG